MIRLVRPDYILEFSTNAEVLEFIRTEAQANVAAPRGPAGARDLDLELLREFVTGGGVAESTVILERIKGPGGNELRGRGVAAGIHAWALRMGISNEGDEHAFTREGRTWRLEPAAVARARAVLDRRGEH